MLNKTTVNVIYFDSLVGWLVGCCCSDWNEMKICVRLYAFIYNFFFFCPPINKTIENEKKLWENFQLGTMSIWKFIARNSNLAHGFFICWMCKVPSKKRTGSWFTLKICLWDVFSRLVCFSLKNISVYF